MSTEGQSTPSAAAAGARPAGAIPAATRDSYYGRPVITHPVWSPEIPLYFFAGGLAGASAPLALVAALRGEEALARRASVVALVAGGVVSPVLLIKDLGVPARFLNMLRVFKVTSPMSVGSWVLSGFGATTTLAAAHRLGLVPRGAGAPAEVASAVLGTVLSTYTAALVANTAVPAWHEARRELPFLFAGSSMASAGGLGVVLVAPSEAGPARRMAVAGAALALAASQLMEHRLGPLVGRPYHEGTTGRLMRAAKALTLAGGAGLVSAGGRRRDVAAGAGAALLAGALAERWSVFRAGSESADDPVATVVPQRERRRARGAA